MTQYYSTHYEHAANANLTTDAVNYRLEHIDTRIDALEDHRASALNPHGVTAAQVAAAVDSHTHTAIEHVAWYQAAPSDAGDMGAHPMVFGAGTILKAGATLATASSSGAVTIDIQKSGDNGATWATIFSTKLTIDATELTSTTAAAAAVLSVTTFSANDLFKAIVDGAGTGSADLTVSLELTRSLVVD